MTTATLGLEIDSSQAAPAAAALDKLTASSKSAESAAARMSAAFMSASAGTAGFTQSVTAAVAKTTAIQQQINAVAGVPSGGGFASRGADIAAYGTALDALRAKYNPLFAASKQYETELSDLDSAFKVGAITADEHDGALGTLNARYAALGAAAAGAANAHAGYSTQAMAAFHATRSLAEGIAYGMTPTQALAMQINHLSYAASGPGGLTGAFSEVTGMITNLITPTTLVVAGLGAVGVAAYLMNASWKESALQLDDTARSIGVTITQLRALDDAASVKGISDFSSDAGKFASSIYDAANGMGSLGQLLRANGMQATDLAGTLESVASLIQRAGSDQQRLQLLQQAGLPATMQWVRFLQQGPDAIKDAVNQSTQLSSKEQELIDKAREFDEGWNQAWAHFKSYATQAIIGTKAALQELNDIAQNPQTYDPYQSGLGISPSAIVPPSGSPLNPSTRVDITLPKPRPSSIPQPTDTVDPNALLKNLQNYQTYVGLLGDIATSDQVVKAKEDALSAAWIQSGVSVGKYKDAILDLTRTQADYSRASLQAQMGVQMFDVQAQAAKEVAANIKAGLVPLDQYNSALTASLSKWKAISDQAAIAGTHFPQLAQLGLDAADLNKQLDTLATGSLNDLSDGLVSMMNGTATVGDAFQNMGQQIETAIARMIIQMEVIQPIATALKATLGGINTGGGLLGMFGLPASPATIPTGQFGHNAQGTDNWRGGLTWVGEKGPELINLPKGAQVIPNDKIGGMMGSKTTVVQPVVNIHNAPPGTTVTTTTTASGQPQIDVQIRRRVDATGSDLIASGESQLNRTLEQRYGLRPVL